MYTDLAYVNFSLDRHCPRVVLAQRNLAGAGQWLVAWKVIRNCGYLCWHPFRFDWRVAVEVADGYGNRTGRMAAAAGERLAFVRGGSGRGRLIREATEQGEEISLVNRTLRETLEVRLYRGEQLLAIHPVLSPLGNALFRFDRTVVIGTSLRRREGEGVELQRLMGPLAEFDLSGIRKGRIIMTGGGHGASALPLRFCLENKERW